MVPSFSLYFLPFVGFFGGCGCGGTASPCLRPCFRFDSCKFEGKKIGTFLGVPGVGGRLLCLFCRLLLLLQVFCRLVCFGVAFLGFVSVFLVVSFQDYRHN